MKYYNIIVSMTVALSFFTIQTSNATVIWNEGFDYSDGTLTTVSGGNWTAFSSAGTLPVQDAGGIITLTNVPSGSSGEDLRRPLDQAYSSGTLYVSLAMSLSVAPTTANGDYFASFYSSAGSGGGYGTRIFASTTTDNGWTFGLSPSGTAPTDWGTDLSLNTSYDIVLKFDLGTKAVSMGVFAAGTSPSSDSDLTLTGTSSLTGAVDYFAIRQGSGTVMSENIDSILTGTTLADVTAVPEPSTMALAAVGGMACLLAVRRKR